MKGDHEMELEEAQSFDYRGEGAANIVLTYRGTNPLYAGKVLRIRKKVKPAHAGHHDATKDKNVSSDLTPGPAPSAPNSEPSNHPPVADSAPNGLSEPASEPVSEPGFKPHTEPAPGPVPHPPHSKPPAEPVLSPEEQVLWADWPEVAKATSVADLVHAFTKAVMLPLLGEEHVDPGVPVHVSRPFLESIEQRIRDKRPKWRIAEGHLELARGRAMVISDHSLFPPMPGSDALEGPTICVEIKPKAGFLPTAPAIAPANEVKRHRSRFELHQHLKLARGEVSSISKYNPLDFFSGQPEKVHAAILGLFETPQNNVRVFRDGLETFGVTRQEAEEEQGKGLGGGSSLHSTEQTVTGAVAQNGGVSATSSLEQKRQRLDESLEGFFDLPVGQRVENLQDLLADAFLETEVLSRLLAAHKLDSEDIEGTIHAFHRFMQSLSSAEIPTSQSERRPESTVGVELAKGLAATTAELAHVTADVAQAAAAQGAEVASAAEVAQREAIEKIKGASIEECRKMIQNFLIAATAKDCGLMATFRPIRAQHLAAPEVEGRRVVLCKATGQSYIFKVSFVDLDLKPFKKIPDYFALDQAIVAHYNETKGSAVTS